MKKILVFIFVLSFLLAFTACGDDYEIVQHVLNLDNIGKTYNELISEYPELDDFSGIYWFLHAYTVSALNGNIHYHFYSSQGDDDRVNQVGADFGDELRVAGVIAPIGDIFPNTTDNMPFDDFFAAIGVTDYEYDYTNPDWFSGRHFIIFNLNNLGYSIFVQETEEFNNFEKLKHISHDLMISVRNNEIFDANTIVLKNYYQKLTD